LPTLEDARERWVAALRRHVTLRADEEAALRAVPITLRSIAPRTDITSDGEAPQHSCLLVEGFCWRYKMTVWGARQILSIHCAGDVPDLQSLHIDRMDHTLASITACTIGLLAHRDLRRLNREWPSLGEALWRTTLVDAAIHRQWMVSLGARTALQRCAHLLCEQFVMAQASGRADGQQFPFPLTQNELGDVLGITPVHVNRTLKTLRDQNLLTVLDGIVIVHAFESLAELAGFDASYLDLRFVEPAHGL
jgi:CRP-like cAMP-binding protein